MAQDQNVALEEVLPCLLRMQDWWAAVYSVLFTDEHFQLVKQRKYSISDSTSYS